MTEGKLSALLDKHLTLNEYQALAFKTALYPEAGNGQFIGLSYVAHKLTGEAGEFSEKFGKSIRDDGYGTESDLLSAGRRDALLKELGDVLWYVSAASVELGVTLEDLARENLEKLASRSDRGMIKGVGDDR